MAFDDREKRKKKNREPESPFGPEIPEQEPQERSAPPRAVKRAPMDEPIKKRKMSPEDVKEEVGFPPAYEKNLPPEPQQGEYSPMEEASPEPTEREPTGEVPPGYEPYEEEGPKPPSELRPAEEPFTPERRPRKTQRRPQEPRRQPSAPEQPQAPKQQPAPAERVPEFDTGSEAESMLGIEGPKTSGMSSGLDEIKNQIEQISTDVSEIKEKQSKLEEEIGDISVDEESIEEIKTTVEKIDAIVSDGIPALIKVIQDLKKSKKKS